VLLDGTSRPWPPPAPANVPRLAAIAIETPVLAHPDGSGARLGQLRAGAIVEMDPKPVAGKVAAEGSARSSRSASSASAARRST